MSQLRNFKADIDEYLGKDITLPSFENIVEQYVNIKFEGLKQATLQQLNPDADNYNDLVAQLDEEIDQIRSYYTEEGKAGRAKLEQKFNDLKARVSAAQKAAITLVENTSVEITAATLPGAIGAAAPNPAKIALDVKNVGSRVKTLIDNLLKEISTALGIAIELGLDDIPSIQAMFEFVGQFISDQAETQADAEQQAVSANADIEAAVLAGDDVFNGYTAESLNAIAGSLNLTALPVDDITLFNPITNYTGGNGALQGLLQYNEFLIEFNRTVVIGSSDTNLNSGSGGFEAGSGPDGPS